MLGDLIDISGKYCMMRATFSVSSTQGKEVNMDIDVDLAVMLYRHKDDGRQYELAQVLLAYASATQPKHSEQFALLSARPWSLPSRILFDIDADPKPWKAAIEQWLLSNNEHREAS